MDRAKSFKKEYKIICGNSEILLEDAKIYSPAYYMWDDGPRVITASEYVSSEKTRSLEEMAIQIEKSAVESIMILKRDDALKIKLNNRDKRFHYLYNIILDGKSINSVQVPVLMNLKDILENPNVDFEYIARRWNGTWIGSRQLSITRRSETPKGVPGYGTLSSWEKDA